MKINLLPKVSAVLATFVLTLIAVVLIPPLRTSFSQGITIDGRKPDNSPRDRLAVLIHDLNHNEGVATAMPPSQTFVFTHRGYQACLWYADALEITPDQEAKIKQMLELTQATHRASYLRDLETLKAIKFPTKEQMDQVEQQMTLSSRRRTDAIASADRFLVAGVLSESQAEMLTKFMWASRAAHALKDDDLARRLGLGEDQRSLIARRLDEGDRAINEAEIRMVAVGKMSDKADRADREARETRKAAEGRVWEVLRPEQRDQWDKMIQSLPKERPKKR